MTNRFALRTKRQFSCVPLTLAIETSTRCTPLGQGARVARAAAQA